MAALGSIAPHTSSSATHHRVSGWLVFAAALVVAQMMPGTIYAQAGALDPTFDADGRVVTDFFGGRELATDVVIQPDGRIVAAGAAINPFGATRFDFALARYDVDGSLDASFGVNGRVVTDFFADNDGIAAIAMQPDGKIVASGSASRGGASNLALARYNTDGSLDTTFGSGGKVTSTLGRALAVALQADGKIAVGTFGPVALARFNADGSLDTTFGSGGTTATAFTINDVTVDAIGRIVAAGTGLVIVGPDPEGGLIGREVFAVARFTASGSRDATFANGATVLTDITDAFGVSSRASAVAVQADGRIVAAGTARNAFALVRLNDDGTLDTTFGSGGAALANPAGINDQGFDVAIQADGKIVEAGWSTGRTTSNDFALARFNADGSLDATFGNGGVVNTDFLHNTSDLGSAVAIAPDGRIVVVGDTDLGDFPTDTFALARYLAAFSPDVAIQTLLGEVQALVDAGVLNAGQGRGLSEKLEQALRRLQDGNINGAVSALNNFSHHVNDLVHDGVLTSSQGQPLTDQAAAIVRQIT
jgi:uncharacterized delta-60 repeat protein